jgi:hypothetical protein
MKSTGWTKRRILSSMLLASALCGVSQQALAQSAATTEGEEGLEVITVTARRQTENLQSTPISITAFSGERLEAQGITQVNRIQDFTPNLTFANIPSNSGIASNAAVYIRGIGQNDFAPTVEPGVGIYIDGVYLGRTAGGVFDLIDVNSVEVLRGPQGTLFGRNTIGGAINLTTVQPTDEFKLKADIKYGTDNRINVRGMVSGPIAEGLYAKLTAGLFSQDGYVDAPALGKKLGNQDTKMVRGALRFAPIDSKFEATIAGDYTRDKSHGAPVTISGIDPTATGSFVALQNGIASGFGALPDCFSAAGASNTQCYNQRLYSKDTNNATGRTFSDLELWSASLTASYDLTDDMQIKSITAIRRINGEFAQDRDASNLPINHVYDDFTQKQFSQEFQFTGKTADGKLNWVTGLYFFKEKGRDLNRIDFLVVSAESGGYYDYKNWAAFAQLGYKITDKLTLTGGLRYTQDRKDYTDIDTHNMAINSVDRDDRPACHQLGFCTSGCAIGAKWSTLYTEIPKAEATGKFELRPEAMVTRVNLGADGRVESVTYLSKGKTLTQKCRAVSVAGNVVETTRLLLNNRSERFPDGLANSSGWVGRNYMRHFTIQVMGVMPGKVHFHRQTHLAGVVRDERAHRPERGFAGGFLISTVPFTPEILAKNMMISGWGDELTSVLDKYDQLAGMLLTGEDPPQLSNRITLHPTERDGYGLPVPVIHYEDHPNTIAMKTYAWKAGRKIYEALGAEKIVEMGDYIPATHNMGTARMGIDPKTSVCTPYGRTHDVENLFISDGSLFPTSAGCNPTLTIVALTLRQAEHIDGQIRAGKL